jgi:cytoskeleton protein RodZ
LSDLPENSSDIDPDVKVGSGETAAAGASAVSIMESSVSAVMLASTVGRKLRAAREAAGLSLADVAQSLKFTPRQIELLEADDYASLPGMTVVRGFIRSYAKLLKLDAEALLLLLDEAAPSAPVEVRPPDNMGVASQPGVLQQLSFSASAVVVLVMAGILLGLWHFLGPSTLRSFLPQSRETPAAPASEPPAEPPVKPMSNLSQAGSPSAPDAVLAPAPAASADVAPANPPLATDAGTTLNFVFAGRSWVEVTDANKQKLHTGENPAGSQLKLSGRPPFDLVIGNPTKVKLTYGERVIDLTPYIRADVARLTLEK